MFAGLLFDLRYGLRQWRKAPRFFSLLLAILVLGASATTAMFSISRGVLLRPLPFADPDRLLMLLGRRMVLAPPAPPTFVDQTQVSLLDFQQWTAHSRTLERSCAVHEWLFSLAREGQSPQGVVGAIVTGGFFSLLGVEPLRGRFFGVEDDRPGVAPVAVISAALWHRVFDSEPAIVGKTVWLNAQPHTVVGVAPDGFDFSFPGNESAHIWTPLHARPPDQVAWFASRQDIRQWYAMGRRRSDVSDREVQEELTRDAGESGSPDSEHIDVSVRRLRTEILNDVAEALFLPFAAVGLVFVAICSNVSSLLLVRAEARRGELAARAAFGATRPRLMRQVLTETLLLFVLAAPLSALAANLLVSNLRDYLIRPQTVLSGVDVSVDAHGVWFCLGTCLVAGLVSGWLPALGASRIDLFSILKQAGSGAAITGSRNGLRAALVVVQVALAFALLTTSGLSLQALAKIWNTPMGFDPSGLVTARLMSIPADLDRPVERNQLLEQVMQRIRALPGVESVAANEALPLAGYDPKYEFEIEGRASVPARHRPVAYRNVVTSNYFETMRIPLLQGRGFEPGDDAKDAPPVIIISQQLAADYFPETSPIGQRLRHAGLDDQFREIIGVVGDVRRRGQAGAIAPETYTPLYPGVGAMVIVARAAAPDSLMRVLPAQVAAIEPQLGVWQRRMEERMRFTLVESYRLSAALAAFSVTALLLATLGIYALVSYATGLKTRELGIRSALGSPPAELIWLIMRGGVLCLLLGSALGILMGLLLGKGLAFGIPEIRSFDFGVCALVAVCLGSAGAIASFVPAWRAVRASPAAALRYE